jgi:ABC-type glycerol-3-phosphate transport system substrate-binding protein
MLYWTDICPKKEKDREQDVYISGKFFLFRGEIMKIRKVAVMILFTFFVLIAGCGRSDSGGNVVTLTVWGDLSNQAAFADCFDELNTTFTRKYPNIVLDYGYASVADIDAAFRSGAPLPDLFYVQGNKTSSMAEMVRAGLLLPLDRFNPDASLYPPAAVEYAQVDGVTYCGYPAFLEYTLVYYNADIFAVHGLKKPATYGEFAAAAETLYAAGIIPFALGGTFEWSRYWPLQTLCSSLTNNDLDRIKNGDINGEYPELVYAFDQFREFCAKGYFGENPGAVTENSAQLAFANGRVAMIFEGTWNNGLFKDLPFTVGRFALPGLDGIRAAQTGYTNFTTYAISAKTKYPEEAFKYVAFLSSLEATQIFEDHLNSIPVIEGVKISDPVVEEFSDFQLMAHTVYHVLSNVPTEKGRPQDVFFLSVIPDLMNGKITGDEGVRKIVDEMNK